VVRDRHVGLLALLAMTDGWLPAASR